MISPNFGGSGHQIEMQFGSPHMGIVRQPPPTSVPPPQTNIHHNPPPWIKPVGNQKVEVEQSKMTNQDVDTSAVVQPIEEVKMDICDTWEQEKVQRLTEEVEKFEQEVMNIEKSSKAKEKGDPVREVTIEPEKLAAKDDNKSEKLTTEDNHKPGKLLGKDNALDKLTTEDNKLDELAVEDVKLEKTVEDDKKVNEPAATNIPVELAADIYKQTTEIQSELKDDSLIEMENLDDANLDNEKEAISLEANKNAKKPEDPKEEIPKELLMDDNKDFQKRSDDGTSSKAALMADTRVYDIQQTGESNETQDEVDHMLKSKSDNGVLEQQPEGVEENKCDVKSEECHTDGDDAMDLQDSSSETNEHATGNA